MTQLETNTASLQAILDTVNNLPEAGSGGGADVSGVTATAPHVLEGDVFVDAEGNEVIGTMPSVEQATPEITVSNTGLVEATATQAEGYVQSGAKSSRYFLNVDSGGRILPGTSGRTVPKGVFLTGAIEVPGDTDLVPSNIKSGVNIFGVTGTYEGETGSDSTEDLVGVIERRITDIELPDGLTRIGSHAFYNCISLQNIYIPDEVYIISSYAFYGCSSLSLTELPYDLESIGDYAFSDCVNLAVKQTPTTLVETIGTYAFRNCTGLRTFYIKSGVYVDNFAFRNCTGLTHVSINASSSKPTELGRGTFKGCTNLRYVWISPYCDMTYVTSASYAPFYGCSDDLIIYTSAESIPDVWGNYYDITGASGDGSASVVFNVTRSEFNDMFDL